MRSRYAPRSAAAKAAHDRRGNVLLLTALLSVVLLGMVAFSLDVGYMSCVKTELQRSVDAGALAGAGVLVDGSQAAKDEVLSFVKKNSVGGGDFEFNAQQENQDGPGIGQGPSDEIEIKTGHWDPSTETFSESGELPSAIHVAVTRSNQPLFFGKIFGRDDFSVTAETTAVYQPRDIVLVLDFSASMNDDSEFASISTIGKNNIIANLQQIYNELGAPKFGTKLTWAGTKVTSTNESTIKSTLGLTNVSWPYPGGSWSDYFNYVQTSSVLNSAGYKQYYGYLTWTHYLLEKQPAANQTPLLKNTSEQPVKQLKTAVGLFTDYLTAMDTEDRLGLAIYTSAVGTALVEVPLTTNFGTVTTTVNNRQAGHYNQYTNIGDGIKFARQQLQTNGRLGAYKMIVLMTDGLANRPTNESVGTQYTLQQAQLTADLKIPILGISVGAGADTAIMEQVCAKTKGKHFNVPGGQGVQQYQSQLIDAFESIAKARPLKVVK